MSNDPSNGSVRPDPSNRRCTAHRRDGERCTRWAILDGTVCPSHGGGAPAVKAAASRRAVEAQAEAALRRVLHDTEALPVEDAAMALARIAGVLEAALGLLWSQDSDVCPEFERWR
jgi:hypothetical protein